MSRRSEHTVTFDVPAEDVYGQLTSEEYWIHLSEVYRDLNARTELILFRTGEHGTDIELRQMMLREDMPAAARAVIPVDMVITREQHFAPFDRAASRAAGRFAATMPHAPGRLDGELALSNTGPGAELRIVSRCKVSIPLMGGTIEKLVLGGMAQLFDGEGDFTATRISGRRAR
jgi:hypothetical protein